MVANQILSGKTVLITGGSMGIGLACAEACLNAGAQIMVCARTEQPLQEAQFHLRQLGDSRLAVQVADVSRCGDVDALLDETLRRYGTLHGLIHCAAVLGPIGPVTEIEPAQWLETVRVNLFGTFLVARQTCQRMMTQGGGRIVLFSGGGAATPFPNYSAYACAKAGVVRLAETLAYEMRPFNIEVNSLAPGLVVTRLHDATLAAGEKAGRDYLERTRQAIQSGGVPPEVAARAAVFLISDRAKGITGKFVAAPYDGWDTWPQHLRELQNTDIFTLRRILPRERGMDWQ
jgi:NAD(P)-dependent dehydrogenase (short-subunit alcohol dehydrogenase family)